MISRRSLISGAATAPLFGAAGPVIDTHIHLFEPGRFPYHERATYRPAAAPLAPYLAFAREAGIAHTIIVHPEPYQDDHRYLEYCFANESPAGLFKGTCLFDPLDPASPGRMRELTRRNRGRIVAARIHAMNAPGVAPSRAGAIKDRDLGDPAMQAFWRAAADLGLAIQMHFLPHHAPAIGKLAAAYPGVAVILDHMGRAGQGKAEDAGAVLALSRHRRVFFKFSGVRYSSREAAPHQDAAPFVRRAVEAFGAERILWGGLGHSMEEYRQMAAVFDAHLGHLPPAAQTRIRGENAARLFGFR